MKTTKASRPPREKDRRPKKKAQRRPPKGFRLKPWAVGVVGAFVVVAAIGAMVWAARPKGTGEALSPQAQPVAAPSSGSATASIPHVFYGSTWHDCPDYVAGVLRPALLEVWGKADLEIHDYLLPEGRQAVTRAIQDEGLDKAPPEVARVVDADSYYFTFMSLPERKVVLVGHPPRKVIVDALTLPGMPAKLLLGQEDMHSAGVSYEVWDFKQRIASVPINTPLREALEKGGMLPAS